MRRAPTLLKPVSRPLQRCWSLHKLPVVLESISVRYAYCVGDCLLSFAMGSSVMTVVNGACLATREDDVAAVGGVCGKDKD